MSVSMMRIIIEPALEWALRFEDEGERLEMICERHEEARLGNGIAAPESVITAIYGALNRVDSLESREIEQSERSRRLAHKLQASVTDR